MNCSPANRYGGVLMLQLFSAVYGKDRQLLSDAYESACDELQNRYRMSGAELGTVIGELVQAVVSLYSSGQHDQKLLAEFAVSRVLLGKKDAELNRVSD